MEIETSRENLLSVLSDVCGVIARKHTNPILANVVLKGIGGDQLEVVGGDTEVQLRATISSVQSGMVGLTFPARKLLDVLRLAPDGARVQIRSTGSRLAASVDSVQIMLGTLPLAHYPTFQEPGSGATFRVELSTFRKGLAKIVFCAAQQDFRVYLNGLFVELSSSGFRLVATDAHRMGLFEAFTDDAPVIAAKANIPRRSATELIRLLANVEEEELVIEVGAGGVYFRWAGREFITKTIEGGYPDFRRAIPSDLVAECAIERDALQKGLSRVLVFAHPGHHGIHFRFAQGMARISARNMEEESAEDAIPLEEGDDINLETAFNGLYITDVLTHMEGAIVTLKFYGESGNCVFDLKETGNYKYVVSPLRM